jgi:hypothetical protein
LKDAAPGKNTVFRVGAIADAECRMDFNKECHTRKNEMAAATVAKMNKQHFLVMCVHHCLLKFLLYPPKFQKERITMVFPG